MRAARTPLAILEACDALSKRLTERYRAKLVAADPDLSAQFAFHLCHNWGNPASRAILAKYNGLYRRYHPAMRRAYATAEKRRGRRLAA